MITIDVILPIYNPDQNIYKAIDSVLNQTYENWHLYIIDDASNDNYLSRIKVRYDDVNDKISYYQFNKNQRAAACRNFAIKKGHGEYIAFIDQDDVWHKKKLELQTKYLQNNRVDAVHGNLKLIDDDDNVIFKENWQEENSIRRNIQWAKIDNIDMARMIFSHPNIRIISSIVSREIFEKIGGFKDYFFGGEDELFWFEVALNSKIGYLDDFLFYRRVHNNNTSVKHKPERDIGDYKSLIHIKRFYHPIIKNIYHQKEQGILRCIINSQLKNNKYIDALKYLCILWYKYPLDTIHHLFNIINKKKSISSFKNSHEKITKTK